MASRNPDSLSIALAAGDEAAFTRVVEPLGGRLFRSAVAILGNREDAEDVVQEVFVALVQSRRRLVEIGELDAYLFASLRHGAVRCAVRRQKDARRSDRLECDSWQAGNRTDPVVEKELRDDLQAALQKLPAEQRVVVSFRLAGELTFAQIAEVLEISTQTVASRCRYALEKLRSLLKEHR